MKKNIIIIALVIIAIISICFSIYFAINNKAANQNSDSVENTNKTEQNIESSNSSVSGENTVSEKELIINEDDKVKYNALIMKYATYLNDIINAKSSNYNSNTQKFESFNSGKFNDKEKILLSSIFTLHEEDGVKGILADNSRFYSDLNQYYIKKAAINDWSKKYFDETINFENSDLEMTNDEVLVGFPTGYGISVFKVKSLSLNETTNEYTLSFDSLVVKDLDKIEEYTNASKVSYAESDILESYNLKYKKENSKNIIISFDRIPKK